MKPKIALGKNMKPYVAREGVITIHVRIGDTEQMALAAAEAAVRALFAEPAKDAHRTEERP